MRILRLITSSKAIESQSKMLGDSITERIKKNHPDSIINYRNLAQNPIPHLNQSHLSSFFTPPEQRSAELNDAVSISDTAIEELLDADIVIIDVPMYNFGIPSTLKSWIDQITRVGRTFRYTDKGAEGLVTDTKVVLAIATGGIYSEGAMKNNDFTEPYLRAVLGFIGISDITAFRLEGTAIPEIKNHALTKALESVSKFYI